MTGWAMKRVWAGCVLMAGAVWAAPPEPVVCLKGLDPVALSAGKEVAGSPELGVVRGRYRYLFSSAENRAAFEKEPERFAVQYAGACARMGPLSGRGSPDRFSVHNGRIYLFASDQCLATFESAPERFVDADDPPVSGTPEEERRGQELIALALKGLGGASKVDALGSYQKSVTQKYKSGDRQADFVVTRTVVFPDRFRAEERWENGFSASVAAGDEGFQQSSDEAWMMEPFERRYLIRQFLRDPVVLLKARTRPDFRAFAAGRGTLEEREVEWLKVSVCSATATLGIDPADGRVLSLGYHGRGPSGVGEVVRTFSDFREVDGLMLPFAHRMMVDGKAAGDKANVYDTIALNGKLDEALFQMPK
jgi:YHS domain-containing protein